MGCEFKANPYDFANKIRDYIQSYVAQHGFTVETVATLLCGYLKAERDFVPAEGRGKPIISTFEPLSGLAMILAYGGGQIDPFGSSGGLYNWPNLADVDWLRLVDLFRAAGLSDAELSVMGWTATGEKVRRDRAGSYLPALPDLSNTYNPYGYEIVVTNPDTGESERRAAAPEEIVPEPQPEPNPAAGPTTGETTGQRTTGGSNQTGTAPTTTIGATTPPPIAVGPILLNPPSGAAGGPTELAPEIQTPAKTGVPWWAWLAAAIGAVFAIRKR